MAETVDKTPEVQENGQGKELPPEELSETSHTVTIDGQEIRYRATAGRIILKEEENKEKEQSEKAKASIFFVAYTRDDIDDATRRPVTFAFNGGPGSSSVWLHLGLLGPRRVLMDSIALRDSSDAQVKPPPPPCRLVDNAQSLLDVTDLVFIDPVSTGYSRAVTGEKPDQFHDFKKDIESVGDFIRLYTSRFQRWSSPKYLIGESYGTTRAAGLAGYLQGRHGMYLNGIMLVSSILNFQSARFDPGNDLPYILFLPTYTATAWYHKRLPAELQANLPQALARAEAFAEGQYTLALMKGSALPEEDRKEIVQELARFTGLSTEYIEQTNLRIRIDRFVKELLRDQRRTVGRLDTRFVGVDLDAAGEQTEFDPSYAAILGPYTAALNDYIRTELGFESDLPYEILTDRVRPWKYGEHQNQYVNVAETLRGAMTANPYLQVFVANGYFDLATPYFATRYTFNHLGLDAGLEKNVSMAYYPAGHMMYIHQPSLIQLKADLARFVDESAES